MYEKKCEYCGKYHAGKAGTERQAAKKNKIMAICIHCGEVKELIDGYICGECKNNLETYVENITNGSN